MSKERSSIEAVPRDASHVFAPADPLLMEFARDWSRAKPYLIKSNQIVNEPEDEIFIGSKVILPMETINDGASEMIRMGTAELPKFLR